LEREAEIERYRLVFVWRIEISFSATLGFLSVLNGSPWFDISLPRISKFHVRLFFRCRKNLICHIRHWVLTSSIRFTDMRQA